MDEKIIESITIKIGKKTIQLTTEEAQKLKAALADLFGKEVVKEIIHEHHYGWYWRYMQPYYTTPYYGTPQYGYATGTPCGTNAAYSNGNVTLSI